MPKFPVDAPKARVVKSLKRLGFAGTHRIGASQFRRDDDTSNHAQPPNLEIVDIAGHLHTIRNFPRCFS